MKNLSSIYFKFIAVIFALSTTRTDAQIWQWTKAMTGTDHVGQTGFVLDRNNNIYSVGWFEGTADFDPGPGVVSFTNNGLLEGLFLNKLSPTGELIWAKAIDVNTHYLVSDMVIDQGYLYILGTVEDSMDVDFDTTSFFIQGSGSLTSSSFISKYDLNGNFVWAKVFKANDWDDAWSLSIDKNQDLFIVGRLYGTTDFDPDTGVYYLSSDSIQIINSYVVKLNSSGNFIWAKKFGGSNNEACFIDIDKSNNIIVGGQFSGNVDFDNDTSTVYTLGQGFFICKLDTSGSFKFVKTLLGQNMGSYTYGHKLKTDENNNIYLTGTFYQPMDFDPGPLSYTLQPNDFDGFLCALDSSGNFKWAKNWGGNGNDNGYAMAVDKSNNIYLAGNFSDTVDFNPDTNSFNLISNGFGDVYLSIFDSSGTFKNAISFGGAYDDWGYKINLDSYSNIIYSGGFQSTVDFDPGSAIFSISSNSGIGSFISKFLKEANFITGKTFIDINGNGVADSGELPQPNILTEVTPGNFYFNSDSNGFYNDVVETGNYLVTIPSPPLYRTVNPVQHSASFASLNNIDSLNDFGLYPIPNINDLRVTLTPLTPPTPTNSHLIQITYSNIGTTVLNGFVVLISDTDLVFLTSTPSQSLISNDSIIWNFSNLQPFESRNIIVTDSVNINFSDSLVISKAVVYPLTGDTTSLDNIDTLQEIITASFDPNYKKVIPQYEITPSQIINGDFLTYTIHFQNTGNDTAKTIVIIDSISSNLWIPSFEVLSSSHYFSWNMTGSGIVEFRFDNILLPDSNVDLPHSNGFIKYRIRPKFNLLAGDKIQNTGYIYFDYNDPIVTNATTNVVGFTAIESNNASDIPFKIFPNPNEGNFSIEWLLPNNSK